MQTGTCLFWFLPARCWCWMAKVQPAGRPSFCRQRKLDAHAAATPALPAREPYFATNSGKVATMGQQLGKQADRPSVGRENSTHIQRQRQHRKPCRATRQPKICSESLQGNFQRQARSPSTISGMASSPIRPGFRPMFDRVSHC